MSDIKPIDQYLAETYVARPIDSELARAAARAYAAAEELTRAGQPVRHVRMIVLPEEETCFHIYEAASAADVREAVRRAGIVCERILDAVEIASRDARAGEPLRTPSPGSPR